MFGPHVDLLVEPGTLVNVAGAAHVSCHMRMCHSHRWCLSSDGNLGLLTVHVSNYTSISRMSFPSNLSFP